MKVPQWLKRRWLYAMGVPEIYIQERSWNTPGQFWSVPDRCVLCGRTWRPDEPHYVAVFGRICRLLDQHILDRPVPASIKGSDLERSVMGFPLWYSPALDIVRKTGYGRDHIRYVCREHAGHAMTLVDCVTNEDVVMSVPPTRLKRWRRDVRYWVCTLCRFVWGLVQHYAFCVMHPVRTWKWHQFAQRIRQARKDVTS